MLQGLLPDSPFQYQLLGLNLLCLLSQVLTQYIHLQWLISLSEPRGRISHGVGEVAGQGGAEQCLHQAPGQPRAVHHGGQL